MRFTIQREAPLIPLSYNKIQPRTYLSTERNPHRRPRRHTRRTPGLNNAVELERLLAYRAIDHNRISVAIDQFGMKRDLFVCLVPGHLDQHDEGVGGRWGTRDTPAQT